MMSLKTSNLLRASSRGMAARRRIARARVTPMPTPGIEAAIAMYRLQEIALFELVDLQEVLAMEVFGKGAGPSIANTLGTRHMRPLDRMPGNVDPIHPDRAEAIVQINALETQIDSLSADMNKLMFQILDLAPKTSRDAKAKLRFLSAMILDGAIIEPQDMSGAMDQCLDQALK